MEFTLWRIWLPCSLVLHLLLLPVLAYVRLPAPPEPARDMLVIVPVTDIPERVPPPPPPVAPRAATRPPMAVKPKIAPRKAASAPSTPPRAVEATVAMKAQGVSDLSGLRHGMGGGRLPGSPSSIQRGTPLAPDAAGGPQSRLAAPRRGPMPAFGVPNGLDRDIAELPQAGPAVIAGNRGLWAAAPGAPDGAGRAPAGLSKGGPGDVTALPEGGQTTYAARGGTKGPTAAAPTAARADTLLAGGADGPIRSGGGGSGLDRDVRGLPGGGVMTSAHGTWSARPGAEDGTGRSPSGIVKRGPTPGAGGGDGSGGTIIAAGRSTGPGPGGMGGGTDRLGIAGTDDRIGPGTGRGGLERDVRGLPGGGNGTTGRGAMSDTVGVPTGGGAGTGASPGRGGPSYGVSSGDGIAVGYPALALMEKLEGIVVVSVAVDAGGNVTKAEVVTHSPYDSLDNAAIRAARIWPFRPAMANGAPAAGTATLKFHFADGKVTVSQL